MDNRTRRRAAARKIAMAAATLSTALLGSSAHAYERVVNEVGHFVDCVGLLLHNPPLHAANCLPNRVTPVLESLSNPVPGAAVVVAPPPPPPPPPIEPVDCGPVDCGPVA